MIAFVRGRVDQVGADRAVVDVGGVGLALLCSTATLAGLRVGEQARLATALVVREDSLTLFGFADDDERGVFEVVQTVSGVGPRLALALLGTLRPDDLRRAVAQGDHAALVRVPGVGPKVAQRLALELADRLGAPADAAPAAPAPGGAAWQEAVHAALTGLGWSAREADAAVGAGALRALADGGAAVPALLRAALRSLDRAEQGRTP